MMLPLKVVVLPSVAEEPTWKKTLHACASLTSMTEEADAVVSVLPIWKTNNAPGSFRASNMSGPVISTAEADLYVPGTRICPPRSAAMIWAVGVRLLAALYAD